MDYYFKLFVKFGVAFFAPWALMFILYVFIGKAKKVLFGLVIFTSFLVFSILVAKEISDKTGMPLANETITYLLGTIFGLAAAALSFRNRTGKLGKWIENTLGEDVSKYEGLHLRSLLQAAIVLEEEGKTFYQDFSLEVEDSDVKDLCLKLANDEEEHKKVIEDMLDHWLPLKTASYSLSRFERSYRRLGLFSKKPRPGASRQTMINYAIEQEKKSIEFYKSFEKLFPDEWKRRYVERLVSEEKAHLNDLLKFRK